VEVKKDQRSIKAYWPLYRSRALFFVVAMQIITTLVVACALLASGIIDPLNEGFWIMVIAIAGSSIGINVIVFTIISEPIRTITYALSHAAGETTRTIPPNPNMKRYDNNGLKPLLLAIYELNLQKPSDKQESVEDVRKEIDHAATSDLINTALDQTKTGFVLLDKDGTIVYANKAAPTKEDVDGKRQLDLIFDGSPTIESWLADCREHAIHASNTWKRVANKLTGEEDRKLYDVFASYEKDSTAEVIITLFERTDDYLPEDNDLDFIAFAAHELRGPITVIRGYLDTLNDELSNRLANDEQELFDRLIISANRLSGYINNILNAAKYDRRHLKVHLKEESVASIYDLIRDDMMMRATAQNRLLQVNLPDSLPTVAADKSSIGEVLGNLIDNAIKYSNEGGAVMVTAQPVADKIEVAIQDNGIGMPSNVISNLFHKFYRSHRSRETVAGTGIGLYICKAIVESHGGTISVRSVEGQGSTFTFSLPIYSTVAEKLKAHHNSNESLIEKSNEGWIRNHGSFRG